MGTTLARHACWVLLELTLFVDTLETFFDARIDLIQRTLTKHSDRLKIRAEEAMNKMKSPSGEDLAENLDREMQKFKLKVRIGYLRTRRIAINVMGNRALWVVCRFSNG